MINGRVIHGDGIGKSQGFATANLDIGHEKTHLKTGVYAARARFNAHVFDAALIVASRPRKVEVYLFDYSGDDFYGEIISIEPVQKVSEVSRYGSLKELQDKIKEDLRMIKKILSVR